MAVAVVQISNSRNREADCFSGTAKFLLPLYSTQNQKQAEFQGTFYLVPTEANIQHCTLWIFAFKEVKGMGKNKVGLTWPMSMQCTSRAKATLRHLAARPGWHRGYWAIRACAKKQDSRSYLSLTTRSSWDMATYTALFLSIMDGARKLLRSCWQHHLRAVPGRNRETL